MQRDLLADHPYKSFAGLIEHQARERADKICLLYPDLSSKPLRYASATFAQVNAAANRLAESYAKHIDVPRDASASVVVCLLGKSTTDYLLTMYGLIKLGVVVFPLSIRNSKAALQHLMTTNGATCLVCGPDQVNIELDGVKVIPMEHADWSEGNDCPNVQRHDQSNALERLQMIFHSSGSTAFPKSIRYTNRSILSMPLIQANVDPNFWSDKDTVLTWGALFHILGFGTAVTCLEFGAAYALPLVENYPPTPKQLVANVRFERINKLLSVPTFLEQLVTELDELNDTHYDALSRIHFIFYGGASLRDELCRKLVNNGVHLVSCYGSTETGMVMMKDLSSPITRWKWMKIAECRKEFIRIRPDDHALIHLPNDPYVMPGIANQPDGSYLTNDILIEDPPGSGEYRVEGRQDDILVHVNGEKTSPLTMEETICQHSLVDQALVFGHQRFCTGVLIRLNKRAASSYSSEQIHDELWKAVQAANDLAPSHSRIVRQMIARLPMDEFLPTTDKGNITRKRAYEQYAEIIDALYDKFLKPKAESSLTSSSEKEWTNASLSSHLQALMCKISSKDPPAFDDTSRSIFESGFDSLHVVQLRNELCSLFPSVPLNFVYEFSTVDAMVDELLSKANQNEQRNQQDDRQHHILTERLVDKYIDRMLRDFFPAFTGKKSSGDRVFLVTGANGSLGSWIVLELLKQASVKKIYCFFRGSDKNRIVRDFEQRQQPIDIFQDDNPRIALLPYMSLSDEHLAQLSGTYVQLCNEVTDIVHSAYRMDFNLTVRDFEKDGILGTYHLMKLARQSEARFHFISSVASSGSGFVPHVKEERLVRQPQLPVAQGYGQSKYVCEHLCAAADNIWYLPVDIYRIGQISGDSENGAWNTSEMVSLIICIGGGELGQMPSQGQDVRWIPVDIAARSIVEIAMQDHQPDKDVHHIVNPHAIPWSTFLDSLRCAGLRFRIANPSEWLSTILASNTALVKLSAFFDTFFTSKTGFRIAEYDTVKSEARSTCLRSCTAIDEKLIRKYLEFWHRTGFLTNGFQ